MTSPETRTNAEWEKVIASKISDVLADTSEPVPMLNITEPGAKFALAIDHTLLKPDATKAGIDELCDQALKYKFKSCCVNGANLPQVATRLAGSSTVPCVVIGFPLGAGSSASKAFEAAEAVTNGAKEIDMVLNVGAFKSKDYSYVFHDIRAVVSASTKADPTTLVKLILETSLLPTPEEKISASFIAAEAGAAFVKTSTGFNGGGATAEDVRLMKKTVSYKVPTVKVKASAGIRSFEKCVEMFNAGAERIGTSSGAAIMQNVAVAPSTY